MSTHTHTQKYIKNQINYIPKMELTNKRHQPNLANCLLCFDFTFAFSGRPSTLVFSHLSYSLGTGGMAQ